MTIQALPVRIRSGATILVPNRLRVITTYVLLEQESWFEDEIEFVGRLLQSGECAVDVGANFGVYTVAMAEAVGPGGKIFAFEPSAETSVYLEATVRLKYSSQVESIRAALSDRRGRARLRSGPSPELNALLEPGDNAASAETVDVATLDESLSQRSTPITFMKIDAEGHEVAVGIGARTLILEDEPLIMFEIRHKDSNDYRFLDYLENLGLTPYRLAVGLSLLVPFQRADPVDSMLLNLFACSPRRAARLHERGLLATDKESSAHRVLTHAGTEGLDGCRLFLPHRTPLSSTYRACLSHFHCAQCMDRDPNLRLAHMMQALQLGREAVAERKSVARCLTLARISADVGDQTNAVDLLQEMVDALATRDEQVFDEACLGFSERNPAGVDCPDSVNALRTTALEALERLRAFSTCWTGAKSLPLLDYLCQQPLCSPEMHRRRQLVRMSLDLQRGPEPHPPLVTESPDNLNPWFWRG